MFESTATRPNYTLVNFSYQVGTMMSRYDFLEARRVILSNVRTDYNFSSELGPIMTRYDFLWCRPVVLITDPQLYIIPLLVNFSCEFKHIFQFWIGVLHIPK